MEAEPVVIPNPQLNKSASADALDPKTGKSFLIFHSTIRSLKSSQGKEMISLIRSRRETEDKVESVRNRINYINHELQATEKKQKKQSDQDDIKKKIRKQHSDFKNDISEKARTIEIEKKQRDETIKRNKEDLKQKIRQAQQATMSKNKTDRDSIRELEGSIKATINDRVSEIAQLRKARVLKASESIKLISQNRAVSQEAHYAGLKAKQDARADNEKAKKKAAEEMLTELETQEAKLMEMLRETSQQSYQMISKNSPKKSA